MRRKVLCACALALAAAASSLPAQNRFFIEDQVVPFGSAGNVVSLLMDADQDVYGISFYLEFDAETLLVRSVEMGAAIEAVGVDWFDGYVDNAVGEISYGAVFGLSPEAVDRRIPAGARYEIARVEFDVLIATPGATILDLLNVEGEVPFRLNIMTDATGASLRPGLEDGTFDLVDMRPRIVSIAGGQGRAGTSFSLVCEHADRPNLVVRVCGMDAAATLRPDGQTIDVVAPSCAPGPAAVEVCTDLGCDSDPAGFTYLPDPPVIESYLNNTGRPGDVFAVVGLNFDQPGLAVEVCGAAAAATLRADGVTLDVTAPACAATGPAEVSVCTDFGCDADPAGFTYLAPPPPPVIEGFTNNAGPPGTEFFVLGQNFDAPGLRVRVCGVAAAAVLVDPGTLRVTAPACGPGAAAVEVCTDDGCDSDPAGFTYPELPGAPVIESFSGNSGLPGQVFTVTGSEFDQPGLRVVLCDVEAAATLLPGGVAIEVTAPPCETVGPVPVAVCTDFGCDSDPAGFTYEEPPPPPAPVIDGFEGNEGLAGAEFLVRGRYFEGPDVSVRVCGADAAVELIDSGTLRVTAPECVPGPAEVEVCTSWGCDSDPAGFTYLEPPVPVIDGFAGNAGRAGTVFTIVGRNFGEPGLRVEVCGAAAAAALLPDGVTIEVTAPSCAADGPAEVRVCTDFGCDDDPAGFTYETEPRFTRGNVNGDGRFDLSDAVFVLLYLFGGGEPSRCLDASDANDDSRIDIADAVYLLNFLFLNGPIVRPPFSECGVDPTADSLDCADNTAGC